MTKLWRKLIFVFRRKQFEEELAEEIRLHRELLGERRRFGNSTQVLEESRETWSWAWLDELAQNLRYAGRLFAKSPGFTLIAMLTLALGIGANTAMFSILDGVLLRPLPYREPDKLVVIWDKQTRVKDPAPAFATYRDFEQFQQHARSFAEISAATWASAGRIWKTGKSATPVLAIPATATFFQTLGVKAALGRAFDTRDDTRGCAVVLSESFWKAKLNARKDVVGSPLILNDQACYVTGVMPASFSFYPRQTQMWILAGPHFQPSRESLLVGSFARLKPGVTIEQAQAEVSALHRRLHAADGQERNIDAFVFKLQDQFTLLAGRTLRATIWLMSGAVSCLLLIACLNVANLLLGRSLARGRELAVRAAIGSGPARLVRQLLTESLLLAVFGSLAGLALAGGAIRLFNQLNPIEMPVGAEIAIDVPVVLFTAGLTLAATLIFGLVPAFRAARIDVSEALKAGGRSPGQQASKHGLAKALVMAEVSLSLVLLVGAALLGVSLYKMADAPLGFDPRHLMVTDLKFEGKQDGREARFCDALLNSLENAGIRPSALASQLPPYLSGSDPLQIDGRDAKAEENTGDVGVQSVSNNYFAVMRTPLLAGRVFARQDGAQSEPVTIVNRALAEEYFPHGAAIGHHVRTGKDMAWMRVVGVVENQKHTEFLHEMSWVVNPTVYRPIAQAPSETLYLVTGDTRDSAGLAKEIRAQIASLEARIPVGDTETMETRLAPALTFARFRAVLAAAFAFTAIFLASIGLHGVLAQLVAQRRPEFGIRMAIGARSSDVFLLVARQGGWPIMAGLILGFAAVLAIGKVLSGLLYGVSAGDPLVLAGAGSFLFLVAGSAVLLPAARAARIDPAIALRDD